MNFTGANGNKMANQEGGKNTRSSVFTSSRVANAEHAASCTRLLLSRIRLSRPVNTVSNWTCPSVACAIAYNQKKE
jgi:hypothetical protein